MLYTDNNLALIEVYETLFNPINNKDYGLKRLVKNHNRKPLKNASEIYNYVKKEINKKESEGAYIQIYSNLENELILESSITFDYDLIDKDYLKLEEEFTTEAILDIIEDPEINSSIYEKLEDQYIINDYHWTKSFNYFIDSLTTEETSKLKHLVRAKEDDYLKTLSKSETNTYFIHKFEEGYLIKPFNQAIKTYKYFESIGVKAYLNWSGNKGLVLRMPINQITFEENKEFSENPENVKLFLRALANLIETKILEVDVETSTIDYSIFRRNGLIRIPCSMHNRTFLKGYFINPNYEYQEAVDILRGNQFNYIPNPIDATKNTKIFLESEIYKRALEKAIEDNKPKYYDNEKGVVSYTFNSSDNELVNNIVSICNNGVSVNYLPAKVIHVLKRSGFKKEEVEAIFSEVQTNLPNFKLNIDSNIKYAYDKENPKLWVLKNLIEEINARWPNNEKASEIEFFKTNFSYYEKPSEKVLNEVFKHNEETYKIYRMKTTANEYYLIKDFMEEGLSLEIHLANKYLLLKTNESIITKIKLRIGVSGLGIAKEELNRINARLNKLKYTDIQLEELIIDLDIFFTESKAVIELKKLQAKENLIENLRNNPKSSSLQMQFSKQYLEPEANIKVCYDKDTKEKKQYIYIKIDDNNGYYELLRVPILQKYIEDHYNLRLPEDVTKTLLTSIPINSQFNYNYFQLDNNIFFNGATGEFIKKTDGFLTDKKLGMNVNGHFKFFRRLTLEEIEEDTKLNGYSDIETLVYTIMSIHRNPNESLRRYNGSLEWLGASFEPLNVNKKIINLDGLGDDGKSTLLDIFIKYFQGYFTVILASELDKGFTEKNLSNTHIIALDEVSTEDLAKHENYIKSATNGKANRSSRGMRTEETLDNLKFGLMFLLSNDIIRFNPSDEALMERDDIVKMYRRFKAEPNLEKGELPKKDIDDILNNDFKGYERLLNLAIIEYNKIRNKGQFTLSTTIKETKEIILDKDILKKFLAINTRFNKITTVTNETLTTAFLNWCNSEDINLKEHFNYTNEDGLKNKLKSEIGIKVREFYNTITENQLVTTTEDRKKAYCLQLLTLSEVNERKTKQYVDNSENLTDYELRKIERFEGNQNLIYQAIKSLGKATINDLLTETNISEEDIMEEVKYLEDYAYITSENINETL